MADPGAGIGWAVVALADVAAVPYGVALMIRRGRAGRAFRQALIAEPPLIADVIALATRTGAAFLAAATCYLLSVLALVEDQAANAGLWGMLAGTCAGLGWMVLCAHWRAREHDAHAHACANAAQRRPLHDVRGDEDDWV